MRLTLKLVMEMFERRNRTEAVGIALENRVMMLMLKAKAGPDPDSVEANSEDAYNCEQAVLGALNGKPKSRDEITKSIRDKKYPPYSYSTINNALCKLTRTGRIRGQLYQKVPLVLLLLLTGMTPMPPKQKPQLRLMSPRAATVMPSTPMAAAPQPKRVKLSFDYQDDTGRSLPLPRPGVAFDIEASSDMVTWQVIATVQESPVYVMADQPQQFFRHRTKGI